MIEKRYQYRTENSVDFTVWFDYCEDDSRLDTLKKEDKYQERGKLLNEYRIKNEVP